MPPMRGELRLTKIWRPQGPVTDSVTGPFFVRTAAPDRFSAAGRYPGPETGKRFKGPSVPVSARFRLARYLVRGTPMRQAQGPR